MSESQILSDDGPDMQGLQRAILASEEAGQRMETSVPAPPPTPSVKLCNIELLLHGTIVAMINNYPKAETTRAMIMQKFGRMPPNEIETGKELRDWIETSFSKVVAPPPAGQVGSGVRIAPAIRPIRDLMTTGTMSEQYTEHVVERVNETTQLRITLSERDILEAIRESSDMDDLTDRIQEALREQINEGNYTTGNSRETDRDHVRTLEDTRETDDSNTELDDMRSVMDTIRGQFAQELRDRELE